MTIAPPLSESARAWERVRGLAEASGWAVELTPRGRTKLTKLGSVLFGPGHGATIAVYDEMLERMEHVDRFMARCGRRP
jgi:hypothetical protein